MTRHEYTPDQLHDDLAYLVDELSALKPLTDVIPVQEKPGDELSIAEIFVAIAHAQHRVLSGEEFSNFDVIIEKLKADSTADSIPVPVDETLDEIIDKRSQVIEMALKSDAPSDTLINLVIFERNQLKVIAERILTITSKD